MRLVISNRLCQRQWQHLHITIHIVAVAIVLSKIQKNLPSKGGNLPNPPQVVVIIVAVKVIVVAIIIHRERMTNTAVIRVMAIHHILLATIIKRKIKEKEEICIL